MNMNVYMCELKLVLALVRWQPAQHISERHVNTPLASTNHQSVWGALVVEWRIFLMVVRIDSSLRTIALKSN